MLVACSTRRGRLVHLAEQRPPYTTLCGRRAHDYAPPWYALSRPPLEGDCGRCAGAALDRRRAGA